MSRQDDHIAEQFARERKRQERQRQEQRELAQRNADAFQAFCESNAQRQQHEQTLEAMPHNRPMGIVGTAVATAIGQWLASKFIKLGE